MKTVLSLHRKWAHAVKTIRILQGLVSVFLLPGLRCDQICGRQLDLTGSVMDKSLWLFLVDLLSVSEIG